MKTDTETNQHGKMQRVRKANLCPEEVKKARLNANYSESYDEQTGCWYHEWDAWSPK